jgi:hypothetical protein
MTRISFYARGNRSGNLLHIETDGCIVNIQVGLHDTDGRQVTSVRVSPDNYAERGGRWVQDGSRVVQLLDGETRLPGSENLWSGDAIRITSGQWAGFTGRIEHVHKIGSYKVRLDTTIPGIPGKLVTIQKREAAPAS